MVAVNRSPCDPDKLTLLIQDRLSASIKNRLTQHLDDCRSCCQQLERIAAEEEFWSDTERFLNETDDGSSISGFELSPGADGDALISLTLDTLQPTSRPDSLGRLDEYEVLEVIGRGGSGVVLKGFQDELQRIVAIKVLSPHIAGNGAARKRFEREAKAAAAVVHPHVVAIHGINSSAKLPYLVMPWINGNSLQERLHHDGPLTLCDILRIAQQVAEGLAAAHDQGLVHRDIKPANILLEKDVDRVLLTDFGLARATDDATLTCSGMIAGTPAYMSPEQARGEMVGPASDLFSLGSVMHAMCTGESPYRANSTVAILRRVCDGLPRDIRQLNPDIPRWLVKLISRLHEKSPAKRLGDAHEVAEILKRCSAHIQQPDRIPLPPELRDSWRYRRLFGGIAVTGLLLVALAIIVWPPMSAQQGRSFTTTTYGPVVIEPARQAPSADSTSDFPWMPITTDQLHAAEADIERLESADGRMHVGQQRRGHSNSDPP